MPQTALNEKKSSEKWVDLVFIKFNTAVLTKQESMKQDFPKAIVLLKPAFGKVYQCLHLVVDANPSLAEA